MKTPQLLCPDGLSAKLLRREMKMSQTEFWNRVGVTQSGGCRYETGRDMPAQVAWALHIAYGTEKQAAVFVDWIRTK